NLSVWSVGVVAGGLPCGDGLSTGDCASEGGKETTEATAMQNHAVVKDFNDAGFLIRPGYEIPEPASKPIEEHNLSPGGP
ncbi:MAG: hypothetical protein ABL907_21605, partial [Hyphomicrobium sp.]